MTDPRDPTADPATDPVTAADLDAYVDDQLPPLRRIEVEAHLARQPALAAQAMADLRIRDELRLALAGVPRGVRPETTEAARRLGRALTWDRRMRRLTRIAAALVLVAAGWVGHATMKPAPVSASQPYPAYLGDALTAHGVSSLRAGMLSQPQARYDPAEIRSATGIVLPTLPADWAVRDAQVFPSPNGPSVELALAAGPLGSATLFAVRPGGFDVIPATAGPTGAVASAYFQIGDVAYVLVAGAEATAVEAAADRLSHGLARGLARALPL